MPTPVSLTDTSTNSSFGIAPTSIRPPFGRELDRVRQEVQHDLPDLSLIRPHLTEPRIHRRVQRDATAPRPLSNEDEGIVDGHRQVEVRQLELHPPRLNLSSCLCSWPTARKCRGSGSASRSPTSRPPGWRSRGGGGACADLGVSHAGRRPSMSC